MLINAEQISLLAKATRFSVEYFIGLAERESNGEEIEEEYDPNDIMVIDIISSQLEEALETGSFETKDAIKGEGFLTYPLSIYLSENVRQMAEYEYAILKDLYKQLTQSYIQTYRNGIPQEYLHENMPRIIEMENSLNNITEIWERQRTL